MYIFAGRLWKHFQIALKEKYLYTKILGNFPVSPYTFYYLTSSRLAIDGIAEAATTIIKTMEACHLNHSYILELERTLDDM